VQRWEREEVEWDLTKSLLIQPDLQGEMGIGAEYGFL
jgi:hypothetical protein